MLNEKISNDIVLLLVYLGFWVSCKDWW